MAKAAQLDIEILAHAEKAIAALDDVKTKAGGGFDVMKVAGAAAGIAVAGALADATRSAMEHETHVAKMGQAYKDAGLPAGEMKKSLEEIEASARKTGQSTDDLDDAYTKLVVATKDTTKAHSELAVAQDLAAFKGVDVATATDAVIKAGEGNTKALKAMGIATTDASGKQLDAKTIMENLTKAVSGQADAYGNTTEGGMKRFKESTDQLKEKLGEALLPAINKITDALMPLFDWLNRHQDLMNTLIPIVASLAGVILAVVAAARIYTAVQMALNIVMDANPVMLVVLAIAALAAGVIYAYNHFTPFKEAVDAVFGALKTAASWIMDHWQLAVDVLLGPLGLIITHFKDIKKAVEDVINALKDIGNKVQDALGWLGKIPHGIGGIVSSINPFAASASAGGMAVTPVMITVYATPGDHLPEVVYDALRSYQRRHTRPELRSLFG